MPVKLTERSAAFNGAMVDPLIEFHVLFIFGKNFVEYNTLVFVIHKRAKASCEEVRNGAI